jgi:predicted membrane chloride channel (bestrophin family)
LAKITALNLIVTFAVALKHKLRFEPYTNHEDLEHLVEHLQTFAGDAWDPDNATPHKISTIKLVGEYLDVSFAESNPRKMVKRSKKNLGNLPLEILLYLSAYVESTRKNKTFSEGPIQAMAMGCIANMNEVLSGAERVVNTPLPIAYSISISQITWIYIVVLPFQLLPLIGWLAIPGTIISAFIILSLAAIGREIENPFGDDTNDLPLDSFCRDIAKEMDIIMSRPPPKPENFIAVPTNKPLFQLNYDAWASRSVQEIRDSLRVKATTASIQNHPMDKNQHLKTRTTSSSV